MELKETGKRNKLFISHCSEIDQTASEIAEYFEAEGIACWIDHRDISSGKNYMEVIKRAISNECFGAIFLLEEHAVKSIQIKQELSLSNGEQKRGFLIYPLYLANVNAEDMDYVFTNKQKTNAPDPRFPWHELEKEQLQELRSTVFADYEALQNNNDRCGSRNSANVSMAQNQEVFRELREGIRRFYAAEHQVETELCNSELIIPKVREFDHWLGLDEPISFEESVKALWKQKDWNCLYIGKGGSGKTSCLYQLMKDFINSYPEKMVFYVRIEECLSYGASGIARYIEKNYIRRFDRMCSLYEIKNMLYNFDFRKEKEPRIILMLDGLSECSGKDCTTLQEELDRIRINKSIQLLMTSSGISQPFYIGSAAVQRFQIQELSEKQIDSYLTLNHCMPDTRQKIPYNIVSNPLMLTIYANTNTFIRKGTDQTEFPCYFREEISSDADILWNYLEMTVHRYSGKRVCEESLKKSFLLKFILPYIAACMEVNTSSSHKDLDEIHSYVALDNPKMFTQNEFFRCVERAVEMLKENAFLNVFSEFDTERWTISYSREECKRILEHDLMRKPELLYKNGYGRYCFCSTVFAKFLAAVHFYHYLKVRNSVKERASDLEIPQFSSEVSVYLGELCEEQKNRPYKDENGNWRFPGIRTEITKALRYYRRQYDPGAKKAVTNLIQIMKDTRKNDLSGQDLSQLDLRRATFSHVICSRKGESRILAAKFDGSIIDKWIFQTAGYSRDLASVRFYEGGNSIFYTVNDTIILADVMTGKVLMSYEMDGGYVQSIDISADGKFILGAALDRGLREWNINTGEITLSLEQETGILLREAAYLDEERIVYVTRNRFLYLYDKEKKERKKLADVNANGLTVTEYELLIPSRTREIYVYDLEENSLLKKYSCEGTADSFLMRARAGVFDDIVAGCSKDGFLLEWERDKTVPSRAYKVAEEVNDFVLSEEEDVIYCAAGTDGILRIDRNRIGNEDGIEIEIQEPQGFLWAGVDLYDNALLAAVSLEGCVAVKDLYTGEYRILNQAGERYEPPFLHLEGCSFRRLNPLSNLNESLLQILRDQKVILDQNN